MTYLDQWRAFLSMLRDEGVAYYRNGTLELHLSPSQPAPPPATSPRAETESTRLNADPFLWSEDGTGEAPTLPRQ